MSTPLIESKSCFEDTAGSKQILFLFVCVFVFRAYVHPLALKANIVLKTRLVHNKSSFEDQQTDRPTNLALDASSQSIKGDTNVSLGQSGLRIHP